MKLLMFNLVSSIEDYLINKLIASGIEVYIAPDLEKAREAIDRIPINVVLMDIDSKKINFLEFIKEVRSKEGREGTRIIILSKVVNKDVLTEFVPYGLIGVLPKTLDLELFDKKIIHWVDSHSSENERRRNVRINPKEEDKVMLMLPIVGRTNEKAAGTVIDLSIQGVAFKFDNADDKNYYYLNQEVENAEVHIGGRRYLSNMKLVRVGDVSVAVYSKPKDSFINSISKYIFEKLEQQYKL